MLLCLYHLYVSCVYVRIIVSAEINAYTIPYDLTRDVLLVLVLSDS